MDLGKNICVGRQRRSWLTLYRQLKAGLEAARTKYVAMAEHDCLYTMEHFAWLPPRNDTFYYNENVYLVQWADNHPELKGMYSRYWTQRLALSQLVCNRKLLLESTDAKLKVIDKNRAIKHLAHAGEPGITKIKQAQRWAESGRPVYLKKYLQDQLDKEKYDTFKTKTPNLDIRHNGNFTGPKRGKQRTYDLSYWGRFEELINDRSSV
jgi:hypothetical protein